MCIGDSSTHSQVSLIHYKTTVRQTITSAEFELDWFASLTLMM